MGSVIIIPGMWGSAASGAGLQTLIEREYKGRIYVAGKEKYQKRATIKDLTEGVKAEFADVEQPILIAHSMGGIIALKLAEQGFSSKVFLICPGIPANFSNLSLASVAIFFKPVFTRKPYIPDLGAFKKYFAHDCHDQDIEKFYATFIEEYPSLYDDFLLQRNYACINSFEQLRSSVKGEIFSSTGDYICPTRIHKKLAELLGFTLHIVDGSHSPFLNHNQLILRDRILAFIGA